MSPPRPSRARGAGPAAPALLAVLALPALLALSAQAAPALADGPSPAADEAEGKSNAASLFAHDPRAGAPWVALEPDASGYDALHVTLTLEPGFESLWVAGEAVWTLRVGDPPPALITLDFADNLAITTASIDGAQAACVRTEEQLALRPAAALAAGQVITVRIGYQGRPRPGFLQGYALGLHDGTPVVFTNSEPFAARTWWPCKDRPDDKFTADIRLIVPAGMVAASNGRLHAVQSIEGGRRLFHWRAVYPLASYLVSLVATNFAMFEDTYETLEGESVPLMHFAYPEDLARAQQDWSITPRAMRCFAERFGEYPFAGEKYGMAEYPWSGAMEHQTLSSMGAYFFDLPPPQDWVVVHELAHQWWGDWVTCATWRDIWLNEGFATYAEALWAESEGGADSLRRVMLSKKDRYYPGSCYAPDFLFNSTVYRKGAWVLHMLRRVLGDVAFFAALRDYGAAHAYGSATTAQFAAACERAWGADLDWFFGPWVYGTGRPVYGVWWDALWEEPDGTTACAVRIVQESSGPGLFRMPLDACFRLADGTEFRAVLWDSLAEQTFLLETPSPPVGFALDPYDWVLCEVFYGARPSDVPEAGAPPAGGPGLARLLAARPNPSRGGVAFDLEATGDTVAEIGIFDPAGRLLRSFWGGSGAAGRSSIAWDGTDRSGRHLAPGVYLARARSASGPWSEPRRIVLIR